MGSTNSTTRTGCRINYYAIFMATGTAFGSIDSFDAWIFVAHEMWRMGDAVVVAVVGAKIINTEERNGTAGGANVGGRGNSGGFECCRTFYPGLAAEGGRVVGDSVEDDGHIVNFGDVPSGEVAGEGDGVGKRASQICNSPHIPRAQITVEGGGIHKRMIQT